MDFASLDEKVDMEFIVMLADASAEIDGFVNYMSKHFEGGKHHLFYEGLLSAFNYSSDLAIMNDPETKTASLLNNITGFIAYLMMAEPDTPRMFGTERKFDQEMDDTTREEVLRESIMFFKASQSFYYEMREFFIGDKPIRFYDGLLSGYHHAANIAHTFDPGTQTEQKLDLTMKFVTYAYLHKALRL